MLYCSDSPRPLSFSPDIQSLPGSVEKAVQYLEKRLDSLTNPYAVAIASYALANEGKLNRQVLFKFASPGAATQQ